MLELHSLIDRHGGVIATHELRAVGVGRWQISRLVESGVIRRVRTGWYSTPLIARAAAQAVGVGGVLTCADALGSAGVWVARDGALHVRVPINAARLRVPSDRHRRLSDHPTEGVRVHWTTHAPTANRLVAGPIEALTDLRSCAPRELYLAAVDSMLHLAPHLFDELARAGHPVGIDGIDGVCESGTETLFWLRMSRHGLRIRRQVPVSGVRRADFLLGERLIVEVDGREFHDTESTFEADRRNDAELSRRGYRVLRFSYRQVMEDWPAVEAAVLAAVFRGDHLA